MLKRAVPGGTTRWYFAGDFADMTELPTRYDLWGVEHLRKVVAWARERGAERVRLMVHEGNPRAQGAYRKAGFVPSGVLMPFVKDETENEVEFVLEWPS